MSAAQNTSRPSTARAVLTAATAIAALLLGLFAPGTAANAQQDEDVSLADHGIEAACRGNVRAAEPFVDVDTEQVHGEAISCVWAYGIATGRFTNQGQTYGPLNTVTREQMASFVARTLETMTDDVYDLPDGDDVDPYDDADEIADAHVLSVNRLTEAGIVHGYGDGTYRPDLPVNREQMATFIATAIEAVTGQELPREQGAFDDVADTHLANVEKLAAIGVTTGTSEDTYSPRLPIRRHQMASFLARSLDHLASQGLLQPLSYDEATGALLGVVDVDVAAHDGFDRVTFTIDGEDGVPGWRARYVSEARSAGSGDAVDVEGDAILQLTLTGMAFPPDLPPDVADELWPEDGEGRIDFGGEAIVEVVDDTVFEGQQELFIGTTGLHHFEVARLDDPRRVYVDVHHTS